MTKLYALIAFVIVAAGIGWGVWKWLEKKDEKVESLTKQVAVTSVVNDLNAKDADKGKKSDAATEKNNVETDKAVADVGIKAAKTQSTTARKISDIEKAFFDKPKTAENVVAKADQISATLIDGLWIQYCQLQPGNEECKSVPATNQINTLDNQPQIKVN